LLPNFEGIEIGLSNDEFDYFNHSFSPGFCLIDSNANIGSLTSDMALFSTVCFFTLYPREDSLVTVTIPSSNSGERKVTLIVVVKSKINVELKLLVLSL
jgi:hypothetical protein